MDDSSDSIRPRLCGVGRDAAFHGMLWSAIPPPAADHADQANHKQNGKGGFGDWLEIIDSRHLDMKAGWCPAIIVNQES